MKIYLIVGIVSCIGMFLNWKTDKFDSLLYSLAAISSLILIIVGIALTIYSFWKFGFWIGVYSIIGIFVGGAVGSTLGR